MSFVRFYLQYSTVYSKSFVFLLSMERGLICLIVKRTRLKRGIGGVKSFNHRCRTLIFSRKVYIRAKFVWIVFYIIIFISCFTFYMTNCPLKAHHLYFQPKCFSILYLLSLIYSILINPPPPPHNEAFWLNKIFLNYVLAYL